jgi:hypothetical protein
VVTGSIHDVSLASYIAHFPNNDNSNDGYKGLYVLRVKASKPELAAGGDYDDLVIGDRYRWTVAGTTIPLALTPTPTISVSVSSEAR